MQIHIAKSNRSPARLIRCAFRFFCDRWRMEIWNFGLCRKFQPNGIVYGLESKFYVGSNYNSL